MLTLRVLLVVDAAALAGASTISDPIVAGVASAPALLVGVLVALASLGADLVPPRRRAAVACSALTIVAPLPFLLVRGSGGLRGAAIAIVALQVAPLLHDRRQRRAPDAVPTSLRRILAALVLTSSVLLLVVVALAWYGARYLARPSTTPFSRGPYLTRLTASEAELAWKLDVGHHGVQVSALAPDGTTIAATAGRLRGLQPGTRYVWTATVDGRAAASAAFHTAPTSTATPITLVSFGDYGSGSDDEYAVGRLAAAISPDLVLSSGDSSYLIAAPPLLDRAIFAPLHDLLAQAPMVAALGEHDLAWNDGSAVISALRLPGHHYAVQYGPVQIVVLGLQADASAVAYATATLGRCATPCPVRLVLAHRAIAADDPILPLLRERHVTAILAGHLHRYERLARNGIPAFTVGTGGEGAGPAAYTPASRDAQTSLIANGLLRIDILGNHVTYQFLDDQGRVRDRFEQVSW
jgi:hypothetical protein